MAQVSSGERFAAERLAQIVGGWATAVGVLLGIAALAGARIQIDAARKISSLETFKSFLDKAIEYPELAYPKLSGADENPETIEFERYEWFVSYLLVACEQILTAHPDDKRWESACRSQMLVHDRYLTSAEFFKANEDHYSDELIAILPKSPLNPQDAGAK